MEAIVSKKKKDDVEDAEIIDSDVSRTKVKASYNVKLITLYVFCFVLFLIFFSLSIYNHRQVVQEISTIQDKIKSLMEVASPDLLEKRLQDFEISTRQNNTNQIDEANIRIEDSVKELINSLPRFENNNSIQQIRDELLNLQSRIETDISQLRAIPDETFKNINTLGLSNTEVQKKLNLLEINFEKRINILTNRFESMEKEMISSKRKLLALNNLVEGNFENSSALDIMLIIELREAFSQIAYAALKLEAKNNIGGTPWARFSSTIKSVFVFRSTTPREGSNTDAILSRAEYHLNKGDFETCLKELDFLDDSSARLFADWKNKLKSLINKTK